MSDLAPHLVNVIYHQIKSRLLWSLSDYGDGEPYPGLPETRRTLDALNQLRHDWARRVGRASPAEVSAVSEQARRALETVPIFGAPVGVKPDGTALDLVNGAVHWTWPRTAAGKLTIRFNNPTDTESGASKLGYIFPYELVGGVLDWDTPCRVPAVNPTPRSIELDIQVKPDRLEALKSGPSRIQTLELHARNYAGYGAVKIIVSGLGAPAVEE